LALAGIVWKYGSFPARKSFYTEKSGENLLNETA
jgi:hypothetical protein